MKYKKIEELGLSITWLTHDIVKNKRYSTSVDDCVDKLKELLKELK